MFKALFIALFLLSGPTFAQDTTPPPVEKLTVSSLTLTDAQFLQGDTAGAPQVSLTATLRLPGTESGYPAVILLHGSGGSGSMGYQDWTALLNKLGIASFQLDSYAGRGLEEIFSNQGRLGEFYAIYDAYRAAEVLAAHPAIDADRIAILGFSRGGIGALYSAMTRFQDQYGPEGAHLVAHIPFYPPCNFQLTGELDVSDAPIRAFHGEADDWNPLPRCRDYIGRLEAAGHDAKLYTYPKTLHAFDNSGAPSYTANRDAQTSRACFRIEVEGVLFNTETNKPFSWADDCVQNGPSQQFQRDAAYAARDAVSAFLVQIFGL